MGAEKNASVLMRVAVSAITLSIFVLVTAFKDSNVGAAAAFGSAAIMVASYATWHLRKRVYYWPMLTMFTAAHLAALLKWNPVIPTPSIAVAPIVIMDFICMVALLFGFERLWIGKQR